MPYLTPEDFGDGNTCRPLSIPSTPAWLALVSGALDELTKTYNWEQFGALTVDECVERMQLMIDDYYDAACNDCVIPEGGEIIRLGEDGHIEVLEGGEWVIPEGGDYYIPPPEEREGGSTEDRKCLAAANATNVLAQLYESLSESWAEDVAEGEALLAFAAVFTGVVGFAIAPITFGIYAFFAPIFALLYAALDYLTADLWDEAFSDQMKCFLFECANDDGGVITFDWDCFVAKLNSLADSFELTELQLRLYLQVSYILSFIGGVDGLNLAGRTTEIESADCNNCSCAEITDWVFIDSNTGLPLTADVEYLGEGHYKVYASVSDGGGGHYFWLSRSDPHSYFFIVNTELTDVPGGESWWDYYGGEYHSHAGNPDGVNAVRWYAAFSSTGQYGTFDACPVYT